MQTVQFNAIRLCLGLTFVFGWLPAGSPEFGISKAFAFTEPTIYGNSAEMGGGAGRYFTGSPADGYGCSACHTGPGSLPLQVVGVPVDGYVLGRSYVVHLAWPEATARANAARALNLRPVISLVAEFVAEDGSDSGRIDVEPQFATQAELCAADFGAQPMLAAQLYQTDPEDVEAPPKTVSSCSGSVRNQRCIVAIRSCGSSELRIRWTAPPKWRGPIWFSAGFVMTDDANQIPNDFDFVTEISAPMNAAVTEQAYESQLEAGCTAAPGRGSGSRGVFGLLGMIGAFAVFRRRRRMLLAAWMAALCVGCGEETVQPPGSGPDTIGLFTPGYRRVQTTESSIRTEDGGAAGQGGPSTSIDCEGVDFEVEPGADDAGPPPAGTLSVELMTAARLGEFDKTPGSAVNYGAVWIEDEAEHYVKGLALWRGTYFWQLRTYNITKNRLGCPEPDVVAGVTIRDHSMLHKLTWDGKNTKGDVVPDGNYRIWIEVQVDEVPIEAVSYPFTKGRMPWMMTFPPKVPPHSTLVLNYQPLD